MNSHALAELLLHFPDTVIGVLVGPNVVQPVGGVIYDEEHGTNRVVCVLVPSMEMTAIHPDAPPTTGGPCNDNTS